MDPIEAGEEFIAHYGVKGMRWGVRKNRQGKVKARSIMKKDRKIEDDKPQGYTNAFRKKHDALARTYVSARPKVKKAIRQINKSEKYKDKDLKRDAKLRAQYHAEISKAVTDQLNAAAVLKGTTREGFRLNFEYNIDKSMFPDVTVKQVPNMATRAQDRKEARETRKLRHADEEETDDESVMTLNAIRDANFFVIDFEVDEEEMSQSDIGEEFIAHYGVKGMKWGIRKPRIDRGIRRKGQKPASKKPTGSNKLADVKQTILKTKSPEEKAAESRKKLQDYKNDTEELRAVVDRMRLEAEYSRLTAPENKGRSDTGKKVVTDILVGATTAVGKSYLQYQMETAIRTIDPNYKPPKKSK